MRRRTFISAALGGLGGLLAGGAGWYATRAQSGTITRSSVPVAGNQKLYTGADLAFGTTMAIHVLHHDAIKAELAIEDAFHQARNIDRLMSIYSEASQVFQLNRDGGFNRPDPHLLTVLKETQRLSVLSGGAFDITVQPLWLAFTQAAAMQSLPSEQERLRAQSRVNWADLVVSEQQLYFKKPGMSITLNGIAQGYAVDLALAAVQSHGITHALLDTGEFISTGKKTANQAWTVGVQDPRNLAELTTALHMDGRSVATSGDYETTFTPDFVHNHIFDPVTGDSPPELASVTVAAPTGLLADGLSTTLFVMGHQKAMQLVARLDHVDVLLVDKKGRITASPGMRKIATTLA